jgi:hypothetical protein
MVLNFRELLSQGCYPEKILANSEAEYEAVECCRKGE